MLTLVAGCGTDRSAPPEPTTRPAPEAAADDDVRATPTSSWPEDVEGLREAVDAFTTEDACRAGLRASTPTAVAEGLDDLRYDSFFDDVCAGLAAVKVGSVAGCDAIVPSATRAGCRRRLALLHARPDACPEDRVIEGREPVCVAWASRAPGLCPAASPPDRPRCRAVLSGEPEGCDRLPGGDAARCRAEVARYATALGSDRVDVPAVEARMRLTVTGEGGRETLERDVLARGVVLRADGCARAIAFERPGGEPSIRLASPQGSFRLEIRVPPAPELPLELAIGTPAAVLSVVSPTRGELTSISGARGTVTLTAFGAERGALVSARIRGVLREGMEDVRVEGEVTSFVRDLDPLDGCVAAP